MNKLIGCLSFAMVCALAACGDDSGSKVDSAVARDMTTVIFDMTGFMDVETCAFTDYEDKTGVSGDIAVTPWDPSLGKRCFIIKAGQTVTWASSSTHPLESTSGTKPSPISSAGATTAQAITFTAAGTYGFQCQVHTSLMHGAIWVLP